MTDNQFKDLERIMKDNVELSVWDDTVKNVSVLSNAVIEADAVAVVLPINLLSDLIKMCPEKVVMQSVSERKPTNSFTVTPSSKKEQEFQFVHSYWQQVVKIDIETKKL